MPDAVVVYLARACGMEVAAIDELMNRQSGFRGLCGHDDLRSVVAAATSGDAEAKLAIEVRRLSFTSPPPPPPMTPFYFIYTS